VLEQQPHGAGQPGRHAARAPARAPSSTAVWTSCPQAWQTPGTVER
jgi:hypothetical protein